MTEDRKQFNLEEFSKKSEEFYRKINAELEQKAKGKFIALDFEIEKYWLGETASDALKAAKDAHPGKLFYLIQIGYPSTFTIQSNILIKAGHKLHHDISRAH